MTLGTRVLGEVVCLLLLVVVVVVVVGEVFHRVNQLFSSQILPDLTFSGAAASQLLLSFLAAWLLEGGERGNNVASLACF